MSSNSFQKKYEPNSMTTRDLHSLVDDEPGAKVIPVGKPYEMNGKRYQKVQIVRRGTRTINAVISAH